MTEYKLNDKIYLNDDWEFSPQFDPKMLQKRSRVKMETVRIPHTVEILPFNNFDEGLYQKNSCYRRTFKTDKAWKGKLVLLTVDGAAHQATVYLNGEKLAVHKDGYTAFTVDLTPELAPAGKDNLLCIEVDSRENLNQPPFGYVIDYMTYGGIYRDVYLEIKNPVYIKDVFVRTHSNHYESVITINEQNVPDGYTILQTVETLEKSKGSESLSTVKTGVSSSIVMTTAASTPVVSWTLEKPVLYRLVTHLLDEKDKIVDTKVVRFGFREVRFDSTGFYLNNKKIKLRGLNRHQSYPYIGYAAPKNLQKDDAAILKYELGLNYVRTSHYPQSQHFIDRCDELGLLVFTEIPGWQHIGDKSWQNIALENVREMILQYRNHPSIFMWGVRINESQDNDELYAKTNALAHELDPSRPTGGVRYLKNSSFLEDVYTFNDFSHTGDNAGALHKDKVTQSNGGYLISEYNGHMYPTKAYDCEQHRTNHAIRHAQVLETVAAYPEIGGSSGWCAFDYNTHKDFGSGDRICYHGVMDMYRNPKMAAYVYQTQADADVTGDILEASTNFDIGEYPAGKLGDIWLFTNADSVKLYVGDKFIKDYTAKDSPFTHLKHPPILVNDTIGDRLVQEDGIKAKYAPAIKELLAALRKYGLDAVPFKYKKMFFFLMLRRAVNAKKLEQLYFKYMGSWGGEGSVYRFDAYREGKLVNSITRRPGKKASVEARVLRSELVEDESYDMVEVRLLAKDEHSNILPFCNEAVTLKADGAVKIIPESVVSLKGGMAGFFVKTAGKAGKGSVTITDWKGEQTKVQFSVKLRK